MRARNVLVHAENGGEPCTGTLERRTCNTFSCDVNCVLKEWTHWGACSKACRDSEGADPGRQYRKRHIHIASKGAGKCPAPHTRERFESRDCNALTCPDKITCAADQDLFVLMDGSGSLLRKKAFAAQVNLVKYLVENSTLSGAPTADKAPENVRIGLSVYSDNVTLLSTFSGDKAALETALGKATWPGAGADAGSALLEARQQLTINAGRKRIGTVLLMTDGHITEENKAVEAAHRLREAGMRLVVGLVDEGRKEAAARMSSDRQACNLASKPCADNVVGVSTWENLNAEAEARRFLVALCPIIESKD